MNQTGRWVDNRNRPLSPGGSPLVIPSERRRKHFRPRPAVLHVNTRTHSHTRSVPAYSSDGKRIRTYSPEAAERYVAVKRAIATYNKRTGQITAITFKPLPPDSPALSGKAPLRKHAHMGQHYSHQQQVDDAGRKAWCFKPFLFPRDRFGIEHLDLAEDVERFLIGIFRAVPLSCIK